MIEIIHRSHGIHEAALHELCVQGGIYHDAGVDVELVDGTGPRWRTAAAAPAAATVAVGGVVADWLRGDRDWNVHFIATVKPLMWVVGTTSADGAPGLAGRRIATTDRGHMPSLFLRLVLERHGLDPDSDVEFVEVRDRPDRLRLLERGDVDASLLGPEGLALAGERFSSLLYVGDHVEFPTVGFAARPGLDASVAAAIAGAMAIGLDRMRSDTEAAVSAMRVVEPDLPSEVARAVAADVIAPDWNGPAWAASGNLGDVAALAAMVAADPAPDDELRRLLHGWVDDRSTRRVDG